jgi:MFS family permease
MRHWKRGSLVRHGMAISVIEGLVVAAMLSFTETFVVPLLQTRLGASPSQIGLLTIIPLLGTVVTGIMLGRIIRRLGGHKRSVIAHGLVQSVLLAGLSIPLHCPSESWAIPVGLLMALSISLAGSIGGPAWLNWMGALVPRRLQSRYISLRARLHIVVKLCFAALFAGIITLFPAQSGPWGLQILIIIAIISRLLSAWLIYLQYDPPQRLHQPNTDTLTRPGATTFRDFLRTIFRTDLGRWTLVWAVEMFGTMLAAPYFATYILCAAPRGLGLSPGWTYVMLMQISVLVRVVAYPFIGRLVELFGPGASLRVAVVGIMLVPISWALSTSIPLLLFTELMSGLCWCLAEVAIGVLLFTCHRDPEQRSHLIGYHLAVVNAFAVLGATIGSIALAKNLGADGSSLLPTLVGSDFHSLFLLSALFRLPAVILAMLFLPSPRALRTEETAGLWRLIPGIQGIITASNHLMSFFRRP